MVYSNFVTQLYPSVEGFTSSYATQIIYFNTILRSEPLLSCIVRRTVIRQPAAEESRARRHHHIRETRQVGWENAHTLLQGPGFPRSGEGPGGNGHLLPHQHVRISTRRVDLDRYLSGPRGFGLLPSLIWTAIHPPRWSLSNFVCHVSAVIYGGNV